jgi:hypothetical protein
VPFDAKVITVLIASPGDVQSERDAIADEIERWNVQHQHAATRVRLEARRWEVNAIPMLGRGDAQMVIN